LPNQLIELKVVLEKYLHFSSTTLRYIFNMYFQRVINLPERPHRTFFLWGPRKSGKTSLLRKLYPNAFWVDLLKSDDYFEYGRDPSVLRQQIVATKPELVVIDEIQKLPILLDEVHWLIENVGTSFVLSGSSARKLKRGHANLLGGRALRYELHGVVFPEYCSTSPKESRILLSTILRVGYIPDHLVEKEWRLVLQAYVGDYLKEEIAAEAAVRNITAFSRFLEIAARSDTEQLNFSNIARECGVSSQTVSEHYQILQDTLLGSFLPSFAKVQKRKIRKNPKFYFSDVGVVNTLARRFPFSDESDVYGKSLENYIHHELQTFKAYRFPLSDLTFFQLSSGAGEVDFIVNDMALAIEVKSSKQIIKPHLKGLITLQAEHPNIQERIIVCQEKNERRTQSGILVLPVMIFLEKLWNGAFDRYFMT
jgi:uncharacterized protein